MKVTRRDLLRYFQSSAGCYVAYASAAALSGCVTSSDGGSRFSFPQGVASGDPQSDAIVLWTRVVGDDGPIPLVVQLARDSAFLEIIAEQDVIAEPSFDHTVRVLVAGLDAGRRYYYRFVSSSGVSRTGRTKTAPKADDKTPLNIAVFSCQDYEQGYFTSYRRMMLDDPNGELDFILHVGDYIYETIRGPNTVGETDLNGNQINLFNADGSQRRCGPLPSGGAKGARGWIVPNGLDDYRSLYKTYLTDTDLQDARALYPFVQTWDDHELLNDYWQSYYKDKSVARLKVASNQAWFEFIPAALSLGGRDVADHHAKDFTSAAVTETPPAEFDDDYLSHESNNITAIESLTIYRSVKWGETAELFVVDGRSYRGPRGLPQELLTIGRHPYPEGPVDPNLIETMNAGRTANGGKPPDTVKYLGKTIPNPRKDAPRGSMLGKKQKAWLKDQLIASSASWKLLGLNVGLMRHGFDDSFREGGGVNRILWTDGWDGYPVERRELSEFVRDNGVNNIISLTGDRHAHMAGLVYDDFDSAAPSAIIPEFAGGAVSAPNRLIIQKTLMAHDDALAALTTFDGDQFGAAQKVMPALNAWMVHGAASAKSIHDTGSDETVAAVSNPDVNPHLSYVDADAYGYYTARFDASSCQVEFIVVEEPINLEGVENPPVRRRVRFEVPTWRAGEEAVLSLKSVDGARPLGGLKS